MSQANLNAIPASAVPASAVTPVAASGGGVRGAIARAAQATGVDFSYLLAQAKLESSLDPHARAATSSAAGLYQFTSGTWGRMLAHHGGALGLDGAGTSTVGAALPTSRAQLLALRYDPNTAAMMAAELAGDNTAALTTVLGRAPSASELYLAHFLGSGGATRFLSALAVDPGQSAAALLPRAAAANRPVFFDASGMPRSLGDVMTLVQTRMDAALQDGDLLGADQLAGVGGASDLGATQTASWPMDQQFAPVQATGAGTGDPASVEPAAGTTSMADTLRDTFALTGEAAGNAPDFVRSAYGRMQALGL